VSGGVMERVVLIPWTLIEKMFKLKRKRVKKIYKDKEMWCNIDDMSLEEAIQFMVRRWDKEKLVKVIRKGSVIL
jgi:hypothetical protein